jgi:TolB protein
VRAHRSIAATAVVLIALGLAWSPGTPAHAAFPGGNGLLIFEHEEPAGDHTQADVFAVRPDGTGVVRLTNTPNNNEFGPNWNPRGTRIAFWRTKAPFGPGNVWVMDADGSHQRRLTGGIDARDPAWNPAGDRLVYDRGVGSGSDLFTLRASDGGDRHQLTSGDAEDFEPAWSPAGHAIAFTRAAGGGSGDTGDIYVLDLRTHHVTHVTDTSAYDHQVGWSPDGSRLVFERDFDRRFAICSIRPDGTGLRVLSGGPFFDVGPAYSPDGTRIAFGSDRGGVTFHDIWVMNRDGSHRHRLFGTEFAEGFPDWQPSPSG